MYIVTFQMTIGKEPAVPILNQLLVALGLDVEKALFSCSYVHSTYEAEATPLNNLMTVPPQPPCPDLDYSFDSALTMLKEIQKRLKERGVTDGIVAIPEEDLVKRERFD